MLDSVKRIQAEPILICTFTNTISGEDLEYAWSKSVKLTEDILTGNSDAHIYRITDMREVTFHFGQLVSAMAASQRGHNIPGSTSDPRFIELAVLKPGGLVHMGARSMAQSQYGGVKIEIFETVEEALEYARQQIVQDSQ